VAAYQAKTFGRDRDTIRNWVLARVIDGPVARYSAGPGQRDFGNCVRPGVAVSG